MSDETFDLIEETSDEMENWLYNAKHSKEDDNTNTYTELDTEPELLYINTTKLASDENNQRLEYDCYELTNDGDDEQSLQHNTEDNAIQLQQQELDHEDDLSKHNLILKETIDENDQLLENYFCQECNMSYNNIEDFLKCHPSLELSNESPEEQEQQQPMENEPSESGERLWEVVEISDEAADDMEETEIKTNVPNSIEENADSTHSIDSDKERYFCYDCHQVFSDLTTAENHNCISQLANRSEVDEPYTLLENDDVYRCDLCNKEYTSLSSFNNHQRWHKRSEKSGQTKPTEYADAVCEVCNTVFASVKNLKLHMKMHKKQTVKTIQDALPAGAQSEYNNLLQFFCEICNKSFDRKLLVIHKNMHQNQEEYNCGKCNKHFENLPSYEIHMQMHIDNMTKNKEQRPSTSAVSTPSDGSKRKHACQYCGKEFGRPYEKVKHERVHTGEKPYECEVCGKTFRVSYSLTLHLRTHTDIRPYVCTTCNKRFKQQSVYVHHLKTHVVERAYRCDICGNSFRTSVQLIGHKNTHSKPYNCIECNRPFASLYAVKIHMKTHNKSHKANKNLKNSCSICGASYARIFALRLHLKEQHGFEAYPTQLLVANSESGDHKEMDTETVILMNAAHEATTSQQMHLINDDTSNIDEVFSNQVDHEESVQNPLTQSSYLDETEAATQTILKTEEISVDNFTTEEIITDWLSK